MIKRSFQGASTGVLILIVFAVSIMTPATVAGDQKVPTPSPSAQRQTPSDATSPKGQLEEMQRLDDRLLSTVHWSLGVVVFLAVLLAGFSWYTNFRVYERDRGNLRDELRVFLSQELEKGREQLRSKFEQSQEAIESSLKEDFDKFSSQLTDANSRLEKSLKDLEERIYGRFSRVRFDYLRLKIEVQEQSDAPITTRLRTYIEYLQVAVEFEWSFAYVDALKRIEKLMRDGGTVSSGDLPTLNSTLATIPQDFSGLVDNIQKLIPTHTSAL
jgi:hypothetical protein